MRALNKSNEKFDRNVAALCTKVSLNEKDVSGVYLYGSRLWGSATPKSDYDFVVVLKKNPAGQQAATWTLHGGGNVDCLCMSEKEFDRRLAEMNFLCVMIVHWMPAEWRWKQHKTSAVAVDVARFVDSVVAEAVDRDWAVGSKKRDKGMKEAANKVHAHAVRMMRIAAALKQDPKSRPNLWCTADIARMTKEDYQGTMVPAFLEEEKERLLALLK